MKTLSQIKDQVAQEHGSKNWAVLSDFSAHRLMDKVILAAIEEDRKDAAEKAKVSASSAPALTENSGPASVVYYFVDKSSITNRPLPDLK